MRARRRRSTSLVGQVRRSSMITLAALATLAVVMAVAGVLDVAVLEPRLQRAIDGLGAVRTAHTALVDQQSGLRGALLAQDPRFLEAYEEGAAALEPSNAEATQLLGADERTAALVMQWRLAQQAWLGGWAAEARANVGAVDEPDPAFLAREKALFDEYRDAYEVLFVRLVEIREATLRSRRVVVRSVSGTAMAAALVVLVSAARRHRRLERELATSIDEVLERLERGAALDLTANEPLEGPDELRTIADGLETMVSQLRVARALATDQTAQLETRTNQLTEIVEFAHEIAGRLNLRYVLRGVCHTAAAILGDGRVVVWLVDDDGTWMTPRADTAGPGSEPVGLEPVEIGSGSVGRAGRFGRPEHGIEPPHLAIPMVVGARVVGVLECSDFDAEHLPPHFDEVLEMLAVQAGTAIEAARLHELTETMARTDALTQLPNRRRFDEDLAKEVATADRYGRPLAVLFVDADHFKSFNDTFGHQAGDIALQRLASTLSGGLRGSDTAYRYGGEEFVLLLRETTLSDAVKLGERLRARVESRLSDEPRPVTISVGVAALPEHGPGGAAVVAAADAALYAAKRAGRNGVASAPVDEGTGSISLRDGSVGAYADDLEIIMQDDPEDEDRRAEHLEPDLKRDDPDARPDRPTDSDRATLVERDDGAHSEFIDDPAAVSERGPAG